MGNILKILSWQAVFLNMYGTLGICCWKPLLQVGLSNYNYWNDLKNKAKKEDTGRKELRGLLSFNEKAKKAKEANASNGVKVESLEIEVDKKINSYEEVG